ncbi:MAG: tetratricopeptide repeat protein, partial [Nitrospira sp.]
FPNDPSIGESLGFIYITAKDFPSARRVFDRILRQDTGDQRGKNGLGAVMFNCGQFGEAADAFGELASK